MLSSQKTSDGLAPGVGWAARLLDRACCRRGTGDARNPPPGLRDRHGKGRGPMTPKPSARRAEGAGASAAPLTIDQLPITDLQPDPGNPRCIGEAELAALCRSIDTFGLVDPVLARRHDRRVIAGHQRLVAARRCGLTTVPVILLDLSADDARLLNIALNQIGGDWDADLLARLLIDLQATGERDLTLSGFGDDDLQALLTRFDQQEKRDRPERFDLDEALAAYDREASGIAPGAGFQLGDHRLFRGDATDEAFVAQCLGGQPAALAFTDPPYNVSYGGHGGQAPDAPTRRLLNDALPAEEWERFCRAWASALTANVAGALYVCMSSKEWPLVARVLAEAGGRWSDTIIWAKDRFVLGRADYQRQYEPIWYGWPQGRQRHWDGGRDQGDVWSIPRPSVSPLHPTQKPLALVERAITNSSRPGDRILDPFSGSGTALIACERTGRRGIGIEIDPRYVAATIARWETFTGETAVSLDREEIADG